jgi:Restriction Enzyme Adenine Methylase Associated
MSVVPLYEIAPTGDLIPFRRLTGGAELYEKEIEGLFWTNPDEFLNEPLLLISRQPTLPIGGRPDVVALSRDARVVVIEVKREVDRGQLAQCLEYAGWGRATSLDELAGMYHRGPDLFFRDWQEFTGDLAPAVIDRRPRLVLIARSFHGRTQSALEFLVENGVPVQMVEVSIYEDAQRRRFINIESEHEPDFAVVTESQIETAPETTIEGRRITISDLLEADLLVPGDTLVWDRPRLGAIYRARITDNAAIELEDGYSFATPSKAAKHAANIPAYDGWYAWRVDRLNGVVLNDLRKELVARMRADGQQPS